MKKVIFMLLSMIATVAYGECNAQSDSACVDEGFLRWAPIPEQVFVRGIPEKLQMGIYQLDPSNRWTPGDQTRASGWTSKHATQLIDVNTNLPAVGVSYDSATGELSYAGVFFGDIRVRIQAPQSSSDTFRIRVLTPTVTFGDNATAITQSMGWGSKTCPTPAFSFKTCRASGLPGGLSDGAPMVMFVTPGSYGGDFFLQPKRFSYVLGDPRNRPILNGDVLAQNGFEIGYIKSFKLHTTRIAQAGDRTDVPTNWYITNIDQCCETANRNGVVNPHGRTAHEWRVWVWNFVGTGMGSPGNTVHQFYIEGRPKSYFDLNNVAIYSTRGSSAIKTTMQNLAVRHTLLSTGKIPNQTPTGYVMHSPIDVPSVSNLIVYGNDFYLWRRGTVGVPAGTSGVLHAAIHIRLRQDGIRGSDKPAYPDVSWNPPVSSQSTRSSPGGGWAAGPETYVNSAFWNDVKATPIGDPQNEFAFKHYISFNRFFQQPGSLPVTIIRDDGSHAGEPVDQFGPIRILPVHWLWVERSVNHVTGSILIGQLPGQRLYNLNDSNAVGEVVSPRCKNAVIGMPCTKWPREDYGDSAFPHVFEYNGELPAWFEL